MNDKKTPNEQAWWDKTWKPFKAVIRAWPRADVERRIQINREQITTPQLKAKLIVKRFIFRKQIKNFMREFRD